MKYITVIAIFQFFALTSYVGSAQTLTLSSPALPSGEALTVYFRTDKDPTKLTVTLSGIQADMISASMDSLRFLVPELKPGKAQLNVQFGDQTIVSATFQVLEHPSRRIVFAYVNGTLTKLSEKPSNDPTSDARAVPATNLLFALQDRRGNVLKGGKVEQSTARTTMEVFENPNGKIKREKPDSTSLTTFSVVLPNKLRAATQLMIFSNPSGNAVSLPPNTSLMLSDTNTKLIGKIKF